MFKIFLTLLNCLLWCFSIFINVCAMDFFTLYCWGKVNKTADVRSVCPSKVSVPETPLVTTVGWSILQKLLEGIMSLCVTMWTKWIIYSIISFPLKYECWETEHTLSNQHTNNHYAHAHLKQRQSQWDLCSSQMTSSPSCCRDTNLNLKLERLKIRKCGSHNALRDSKQLVHLAFFI